MEREKEVQDLEVGTKDVSELAQQTFKKMREELKKKIEVEEERRKMEIEAEVRKDQSSYQIKYQFKLPLVYYREKGLAKVEQVVPALVLTVVDDDEPYRRTLQIFTEQGDHIVRNATFDKEKVGCWFPIS